MMRDQSINTRSVRVEHTTHSHLLLICIVVLGIAVGVVTPADATCLASGRQVQLPDGSVRMKAYACSLSSDGEPTLQVEFNRLSETAAGLLVHDSSYPELATFYGSWTVIKNKVFDEAKRLFNTYGVRETSDGEVFEFKFSSAGGASKDFMTCEQQGKLCKRTIWYFTHPRGIGNIGEQYSGPLEARPVEHTMPASWKFAYSTCPAESYLLDCVTFWRSLSKSELRQISDHPFNKQIKRYFDMISDITGETVPEEFLIISTNLNCDDCLGGSSVLVSKMILHTVFIKNVSTAPITVDSLIGSVETSTILRSYGEGKSEGAVQTVRIEPVTLSPGQSIVVPLRISFRTPGQDFFGKEKKVFESILAFKPEYLARRCDPKLRIRRDSFRPPSVPSLRFYSYGPAIDLKGIGVSGQPLEFDRPLANFIEIAAYAPVGSCPYVFSYDDQEQEWIRHGKIIDNASAPEKETTGQIRRDGLVTRFKIGEEDPEMTFVHRVRLELTLDDGNTLVLMPRNRFRPESAGHYDRIKYGAEREYDFDLPVDVNPADVLRSTLAVTGYYLRYSAAASIDNEAGK
jgi:hypothetical protein